MHFGIIGSGPIGLSFAALLSQSGHRISLLCRDEKEADAVRGASLNLSGLMDAKGKADECWYLPSQLIAAQPDFVLLCTKATANADIVHQLAHAEPASAHKSTVYVSCQNGIDVEDVMVHYFGEAHVLRMILNFGCGIVAGESKQKINIDVKFSFANILSKSENGEGKDSQLASILAAAGMPIELSKNYKREAFRKSILNTALGTVCAITKLTMREVMQRPDLHRMVKEIVREGALVGSKLGFDFGSNFIDEAMAYMAQGGDHIPSLAVDIANGRLTENPWLAGAIYHYAERLGLEVPVTQTTYYFIKNIEGRI